MFRKAVFMETWGTEGSAFPTETLFLALALPEALCSWHYGSLSRSLARLGGGSTGCLGVLRGCCPVLLALCGAFPMSCSEHGDGRDAGG